MTTYDFHPLAVLFPLMEGTEFDELVADIKTNGLQEHIALYERKILDGRNRYRACLAAKVTPVTYNADPFITDPAAYVITANLHRRHLTAEQKRELIAKLLTTQPEKSDRRIAKTVKVSPTTVGTVRAELEETGDVSKLDTRTDSKGRKQAAKKSAKKAGRKVSKLKPVKPDPRIISPKLADRVGRFAHDLILSERLLAIELRNLIMLEGARERLWADLDTGLKIEDVP
jgi:ParB-like chromosome segregation protein Spo0J